MTEFNARAKFGTRAMMSAPAPVADAPPAALSDQARAIADRFSDRPISRSMLSGWVRIIEFLAVLAIGFAVYLGTIVREDGSDPRYLIPLVLGALFTIALIQAADGYNTGAFRSIFGQIGRIAAAWTLVFAGFAVAIFFLKLGEFYSRLWFTAWYIAGFAFFLVFRTGVAVLVGHWMRDGRLQRRAVIVGGGETAAELIRSMEASADKDVQICGIFDDRAGDRSPAIVQGYPRLGTIAELVAFARIAKIDMLIVSLPITAENRLLQILRQLWVLPVDIRLSAHTNKLRFRPRSYSYIGAVPFLDVFDKPIADWDSIVKRSFDLVFASLALVLLSPVLAATAIAIKLDSKGPVLFRQKRYGFNNEVIDVFKFRSMYAEKCDYEAKVAVTKGDPRVTRVGRFIRKTSIDELPQLINVLIGNLSLVGPRPHAVGSNTQDKLWEAVVDGYFARHKVKPGVTGWAQINGWRGEVDTSEKLRRRVEHDLYYIENWSPLLDLQILVRTPLALVNTENAY
ncbi:undecaprenyl-phosphate glucose phosphotransferase [Labrys wisconsinensis]|uniref:Undecaprenyl-phosphate glucose phosphotransferase n=1 Tax=Labrys wisconsinensis TaxID=425677 RepID=A0ABU0J4Y4_9HYPH|nr:undecaprenyl-phosphate glucose phosphotransferase [Labrys wisconsinensis]MDQ0469327.1 Undecaprenyl-phosphate glucose phosphotransferase [Labrys wisconsinensis]